jgi:peptide/nickel transport system permease protein
MSPRTKKMLDFCAEFSRNRIAAIAFIIFILILFVAIFAPFVAPTNPYDLASVDIMNSRLSPGTEDFQAILSGLGLMALAVIWFQPSFMV